MTDPYLHVFGDGIPTLLRAPSALSAQSRRAASSSVLQPSVAPEVWWRDASWQVAPRVTTETAAKPTAEGPSNLSEETGEPIYPERTAAAATEGVMTRLRGLKKQHSGLIFLVFLFLELNTVDQRMNIGAFSQKCV